MKVTLYEVARRCGVSPSTVSRAFRGDTRIKEETREKIKKVARELNYVPLRNRRGSSARRSKIVALIVTDISNPFFPEIVHGVEDAAFDSGYRVSLWNTREDTEREMQYMEMLRESDVGGVILGASRLQEEEIRRFMQIGIPCVVINRIIDEVPSVFADYEDGAYQATRYLLHLGHERIALINGPANAQPSLWRERGFRKALEEFGKEVDGSLLSFNPPLVEGGYVATLKLLSTDHPPTAIFAYNDLVALGAMKALREKGLSVPRDISIIGYDDIFLSPYLDPPLTSVSQPKYTMGKLAFDLLLRLLNGERIISNRVRLRPELVVRSSCGVRV